MQKNELLTMQEAADMIGMTQELLLYYIKKGKGPKCKKIGRFTFPKRSSVKAWKKPKPEKCGPRNDKS